MMNVIAGQEDEVGLECIGHRHDVPDVGREERTARGGYRTSRATVVPRNAGVGWGQ